MLYKKVKPIVSDLVGRNKTITHKTEIGKRGKLFSINKRGRGTKRDYAVLCMTRQLSISHQLTRIKGDSPASFSLVW